MPDSAGGETGGVQRLRDPGIGRGRQVTEGIGRRKIIGGSENEL